MGYLIDRQIANNTTYRKAARPAGIEPGSNSQADKGNNGV